MISVAWYARFGPAIYGQARRRANLGTYATRPGGGRRSDGRVGGAVNKLCLSGSAAVAQAAQVAAVGQHEVVMESMSRAPCPSPRRARLPLP